MRKLQVVLVFSLFLCFIASSALPLSYEIDIGGDGSFETGESVNLCNKTGVPIDIYIDGYACPPDDTMFGVDSYFTLDESLIQVNSCYPYSAGGCDPSLSGCTQQITDGYKYVCSNFSHITVIGGRQKVVELNIDPKGLGVSDLVVADDQTAYGYSFFTDGFVSDCNWTNIHPSDGIVTLENLPTPCKADFNSDDRVGLADLVVMKEEFLREDCDINPCQADCNDDNRVDLEDLSILRYEFLRTCPFWPCE